MHPHSVVDSYLFQFLADYSDLGVVYVNRVVGYFHRVADYFYRGVVYVSRVVDYFFRDLPTLSSWCGSLAPPFVEPLEPVRPLSAPGSRAEQRS